ncbi:hypothetical protein FACS1894193_00990 [Bacilli bacterium]|nr:hypothetical protein FACS1894193_00990 [Bacilli bacterium]
MKKKCSVYYSECISYTIMDGEVFVFNEDTNKLYILKEKEKVIWELINIMNDVESIHEKLKNVFVISVEDVEQHIKRLCDAELLYIQEDK